jgi:hypothetical protein
MTTSEQEILKDMYNVIADIAITSGIYSAQLAEKMAALCQRIDLMVPTDSSEDD